MDAIVTINRNNLERSFAFTYADNKPLKVVVVPLHANHHRVHIVGLTTGKDATIHIQDTGGAVHPRRSAVWRVPVSNGVAVVNLRDYDVVPA